MTIRDHRPRARRSVLVAAAGFLVVGLAACSSGSGKSTGSGAGTSSTTAAPAEVARLLDKASKEHVAGKLDDAVRDYKAVVASDPKNKFAHYKLGLIDQTREENAAAEDEYRLTLSIDGKYVPALYNLAILRTADGDKAGAIELYRKAIANNPKYGAAHFNLGSLLLEVGKKSEGQLEIAAALKLDPSLPPTTTG